MHFHPVHLLAVFALIPGSLIFAVVLLWRILRAMAGWAKPDLPILAKDGSTILSEAGWHLVARRTAPLSYAMFETFPAFLRRLGQKITQKWRNR